MLGEIRNAGMMPAERVLRLGLGVKWEIGEAGGGGGLKAGDVMNSTSLHIVSHPLSPVCLGLELIIQDPNGLNIEDIVITATRTHAVHLTQTLAAPLLASSRIALLPKSPPSLVGSESIDRPISLHMPLPSRTKSASLVVGISARTGLVEMEDEGAKEGVGSEERRVRVRMVLAGVNEGRTRIMEEIGRLMVAVSTACMRKWRRAEER
jgi:mediator of RNA polymerase II transcription subunit 14